MMAAAVVLVGWPRIAMAGPASAETAHVVSDAAVLVLGEGLAGRFVVQTEAGDPVAEVHVREGRSVELTLEAGGYDVRCERDHDQLVSTREFAPGERVVLRLEDFVPATPEEPESRPASGLLLSEQLHGRFIVRTAERELVTELFKPRGREVLLGLEPGVYEVRSEGEEGPSSAVAVVGQAEELELAPEDFAQAEVDEVRRPGGVGTAVVGTRAGLGPLRGRHRLELSFGVGENGASGVWVDHGGTHTSAASGDAWFSFGYSHWLSDTLAVTLAAAALDGQAEVTSGYGWETTNCDGVGSLLLGVRQYFGGTETLRPFLGGSLGPYVGGTAATRDRIGDEGWTESRSVAAFGGYVGAGVDLRVGRSCMLSVGGGYRFMSDFSSPVGGRDNFSGWDGGLGVSWLFGKGRAPE